MKDWNVVATAYADGYSWAHRFLKRFGSVAETQYYNTLVMKVDDIDGFIAGFAEAAEADAEVENSISRLSPCAQTFDFAAPEDFEARARDIVVGWRSALAGKAFHVRLHRRGFRKQLPSQDEERFLDGALRAALDADGTPGRIAFEDPDAIIDVETVGGRAGLSLWAREDLARYTFLKLD